MPTLLYIGQVILVIISYYLCNTVNTRHCCSKHSFTIYSCSVSHETVDCYITWNCWL